MPDPSLGIKAGLIIRQFISQNIPGNIPSYNIVYLFYFVIYRFNISSRPASANGVRGSSANGLRGGGRHVPYRNSLLTMLLRDSLGESRTTLIAPDKAFFFHLKNIDIFLISP